MTTRPITNDFDHASISSVAHDPSPPRGMKSSPQRLKITAVGFTIWPKVRNFERNVTEMGYVIHDELMEFVVASLDVAY